MPVSTLDIFTVSKHQYTFYRPIAVANSADWLHLSISARGRYSGTYHKVLQHLQNKQFAHERQSTFLPFLVEQTTNRDFLILLQWYMCWQSTRPGHVSTCRRCSTTDQKAPQHLEYSFAIKASQCSGHLYWIKPWIETFWSDFLIMQVETCPGLVSQHHVPLQ